MAETTVATLRRLRFIKSDKGQLLVIKVPEDVTIMILPEAGLTDEAKEAFIDLDPNAEEFAVGARLTLERQSSGRCFDGAACAWMPVSTGVRLLSTNSLTVDPPGALRLGTSGGRIGRTSPYHLGARGSVRVVDADQKPVAVRWG
jgi:hypothetical protein